MADGEKKDPLQAVVLGELAKWLEGRSLEDLEVIELDGEALYPDSIPRFNWGTRKIEETPVYLRVHGGQDRIIARQRVIADLAPRSKSKTGETLITTIEQARTTFGADVVEHAEAVHLLALSLRRREDPKLPLMAAQDLEKVLSTVAVDVTLAKIEHWRATFDQRISEAQLSDPKVFWPCVAAIAKRGDLGPLVVIAGPAQPSFIIRMAVELQGYRTASSSQPSAESSTSSDRPTS
jgi:hypothetical protein